MVSPMPAKTEVGSEMNKIKLNNQPTNEEFRKFNLPSKATNETVL